VEAIARDFACFRAAQRELVTALLRAGRFRVALAEGADLLLCHAGVTRDLSGGDHPDAREVAAALNARLDATVAVWQPGTALVIPGLHQPGNAAEGAGRGIFFHRPARPSEGAAPSARTLRRRFDPRHLPLGLTQIIGHTRDFKCRQLLKEWAEPLPVTGGCLRHLRTDGRAVRYTLGLPQNEQPETATLIFADGGMAAAAVDAFELFDLDRRRVFVPPHALPVR
jgi:hypothetical protein